MTFGELIQRQISQGKEILTKIEALQAIPVPKNDFGDGMAMFGVPRQQPKYDETQISSIKSEMHKWQNVSLEVLRNGLTNNSPFISQFQETVTDKHYVYNIQTSMKREVTNGVDVLESVSESLELNLVNGEANPTEKKSKVKVFISHASKDKSIIQPFKDIILKQALGLKDENIVCTSFESTGVPPGDSIPQYIKDNIGNTSVFLAMVSNHYKASEVCMNEVGAAWALGKKPIQVVLPGVEFDKLGWLLNLDKAARIDDGSSLDYLAEVICEKTGISMPTPLHWNSPRQEFLDAIAIAVNTIAETKPSCYLCFKDGSQETTIHPKFTSRFYREPYPKNNHKDTDVSEDDAYSVVVSRSIMQPNIVVAKPLSQETDYSKCQIVFYFVNEGDSLENISVDIYAGDGVSFDEYNTKKIGIAAGLDIIAHSANYSIDEESYWCKIGDFNADSNRGMPLLYVGLPCVCKLYDSFTTYEDYYPKQVTLNYVISTKHKKFKGSLLLNIEPVFVDDYVESDEKSGKVEILPYIERE